jgi:hypothetical protein
MLREENTFYKHILGQDIQGSYITPRKGKKINLKKNLYFLTMEFLKNNEHTPKIISFISDKDANIKNIINTSKTFEKKRKNKLDKFESDFIQELKLLEKKKSLIIVHGDNELLLQHIKRVLLKEELIYIKNFISVNKNNIDIELEQLKILVNLLNEMQLQLIEDEWDFHFLKSSLNFFFEILLELEVEIENKLLNQSLINELHKHLIDKVFFLLKKYKSSYSLIRKLKKENKKIYEELIIKLNELEIFNLKGKNKLKVFFFKSQFRSLYNLFHILDQKISIFERDKVIYYINHKRYQITFKDAQKISSLRLEKFNKLFNNNYYLKKQTTKPRLNHKDLISRCNYKLLNFKRSFNEYRELILANFTIDIIEELTIGGTAMHIFLKMFYTDLDKFKAKNSIDIDRLENFKVSEVDQILIGRLTSEQDKYVRESYFGGDVDLYIPSLENGYLYDVNSLYPAMMLKDLPVGRGKFVNKITHRRFKDFFGFLKVVVYANKEPYMDKPLLPLKIKINGETKKVIKPNGVFVGTFFSEELKYAETLGYHFKIISGIEFQRAPIFKNYASTLYNKRLEFEKSNPLNKIYKLLLNSLYGKFGQEINSYGDEFDSSGHHYRNIAVQISSAITAYGRVEIHKYKTLEKNPCFYSDTDSVFLQKPLPDYLIGSKLGQMKFEGFIKKAVFLSSKVYYYVDAQDNIVIKYAGLTQSNTKKQKKEIKDFLDKKLFIENKYLELQLKQGNSLKSYQANYSGSRTQVYKVISKNKKKEILKWVYTNPLWYYNKEETKDYDKVFYDDNCNNNRK